MIRTCDGTDPNLYQSTDDRTPCACGRTFDDVELSVIFPHVPVRGSMFSGSELAPLPTDHPINDVTYISGMHTLTVAARLILLVDVDALRKVIAHAQTLAPVIEPTAYARGGGRRLAEQREFLDAVANLREVCERFRPEDYA